MSCLAFRQYGAIDMVLVRLTVSKATDHSPGHEHGEVDSRGLEDTSEGTNGGAHAQGVLTAQFVAVESGSETFQEIAKLVNVSCILRRVQKGMLVPRRCW